MKKLISFLLFVFVLFSISSCTNTVETDNLITSQRRLVYKTSFGSYIYFYNLAETEKGFCSEDSDISSKVIMCENYKFGINGQAQEGNEFYGWRYGEPTSGQLVRLTAIDNQTGEEKIWVDNDKLRSFLLPDNSDIESIPLKNFLIDGDSVYARIEADLDDIELMKDINERIVKISKSGDTIEFVGDENLRALEFVVRDGWIYYADNGYVLDESSNYYYDSSKIGLYKIKTNGMEKTLIRKGSGKQGTKQFSNVGDLALLGDYIYFLDMPKDSLDYYPSRMKTDGSDYEQLSVTPASIYTIDCRTNTMYFLEGRYGQKDDSQKQIKKLSIDSHEDELFCYTPLSISAMTVFDNYLYYHELGNCPTRQEGIDDFIETFCYRTDIDNSITEGLEIKTHEEWIESENGPECVRSHTIAWNVIQS